MPRLSVVGILALGAGVVVGSGALAAPVELVSPVGVSGDRCPTFSWSAVSGAAGYELVVYPVSEKGAGEEPLLAVRLPGGAGSWTPPGSGCLAAGGRYAWTLRVLGEEGASGWSEPALFEVATGPSLGEVEAAIATLRRYLADGRGREAVPGEGSAPEAARGETQLPSPSRGEPAAGRPREGGASLQPAGAGLEKVTAASVPSPGSRSLTVDANVALGAASNLFKDGSVFLWDDTTGNTALGREALASATGTADRNTAVGWDALRYTVAGGSAFHGSFNTALGYRALRTNTTGYRNSASGDSALFSNTTGSYNTASGGAALFANTSASFNTATGDRALFSNTTGFLNTGTGYRALFSNTTGDRNVAIGPAAGYSATTGDDNLFLGSGAFGAAGEGHTIRIGGATGTGTYQQNRTFIAGIFAQSVDMASDVPVLIDNTGKLGTTTSSLRFKEQIEAIGSASSRLLDLRPVSFRFKGQDAEDPIQYGLLAEQVAEVMPELVVRDGEGQPYLVRYHVLIPLLLNELQRADRELLVLRDRLDAVERGRPPERRAAPWWRRLGGSRDRP